MAAEPNANVPEGTTKHMNAAAANARAQLAKIGASDPKPAESNPVAAGKGRANTPTAAEKATQTAANESNIQGAFKDATEKLRAEERRVADLASAQKKLDAAKAEFGAAKEAAGKLADKGASAAKLAEAENKYLQAAHDVQEAKGKVAELHLKEPAAQAKHDARQQTKANTPAEPKPVSQLTAEERTARLQAAGDAKAARLAGQGPKPLGVLVQKEADVAAKTLIGRTFDDVKVLAQEGGAFGVAAKVVNNFVAPLVAAAVVGVGLHDANEKREAGDTKGAAETAGEAVGGGAGTWAGAKAGLKMGSKLPASGKIKTIGTLALGLAGAYGGEKALGAVGSWIGGSLVDDNHPATAPNGQQPAAAPAASAAASAPLNYDEARDKFKEAVFVKQIYAETGRTVPKEAEDAVTQAQNNFSKARQQVLPAETKGVRAAQVEAFKNDFTIKAKTEIQASIKLARESYDALRDQFRDAVMQEETLKRAGQAVPDDVTKNVADARKVYKDNRFWATNETPEKIEKETKAFEDLFRSDAKKAVAQGTAPAATPAPAQSGAAAPAAPAGTAETIIIKPGDSLSKLAQDDDRLKDARKAVETALGTTDRLTVTLVLSMAIAKANGIEKPDYIQPGWKIDVAKVLEAIPDVAAGMKVHPAMKDDNKITFDEYKDITHGLKGKTTNEIIASVR